jgi:hypothetical protein
MHTLARRLGAALAVLSLVVLFAPRANARVLAAAPTSPFAAPSKPSSKKRGKGVISWLLAHIGGGGGLRPLGPVDESTRRPDSLGGGWAVRWKIKMQ